MNLNQIRSEYLQDELHTKDLKRNPIEMLKFWMDQVLRSEILYPNAANLATVDSQGIPHSRIILIKDIKETGITFFTDYSSHKGQQILQNSNVCINLFWKEFDRQIRMNGIATKLSKEESEKYFQSRPKDSQISATASSQSSVITKEELEEKVKTLNQQYQNDSVLPCPEKWGGFFVEINEFEFWQGRPNRLHDRFRYSNKSDWKIERLSP